MSSRVKQSQVNFNGGINTRDNALSLKENEWSKFYNIYPGSSSPTPREGTTYFSTAQFDGVVAYTIAFEDDDVGETIIAILTDGRFQAIIKGNANVIDLYDAGVPAPAHDEISHVFADKAIFLFSPDKEFNLVIEQDIFVSGIGSAAAYPYFSVRSNFIHNFSRKSHPDNYDSYWFIEPADNANDGIDQDKVVAPIVGSPNSGNSNDLGFDGGLKEAMFFGYAIGYVRRIDEEGFEGDKVTPKETSVYAPGAMESNYNPSNNVRITGIRKSPLEYLDAYSPTGNVAKGEYTDEIATKAGEPNVQTVDPGGRVWDKENGILFKAIIPTFNILENLSSESAFIIDSFSDEANDGVPNMRVYIPQNEETGRWQGTDGQKTLSMQAIFDVSNICHPHINGYYDEQITHIRIYRTLQATSFEAAKGNSYRFLVDIPIDYVPDSGKPYWVDTVSDAELSGSDNILTFWGTTPPPLAKYSKYHNGRIWVGGEENLPGRFWYSQFPQDATAVRKYLTHFSPDINWVDCNQDTGDFARGIGETADQLIFLMKKSVWGLFRGIPEDAGPQRLSSTRGCYSDESITQVDKTVYYLSQEGPAAIVGREVHLLENFKAGEFWSLQGNIQQESEMTGKNLFKLNESNLKTLRAWYHEETWFISYRYDYDGETKWICIGFFLSDINQGMGAWQLEFGVVEDGPQLQQITNIAQWDSSRVAFTIAGSNFNYNFLDSRAIDDLGTKFWVGAKSRRVYAQPDRRERYGELWDLLVYAEYQDAADMEILVYVDKDNIIANNSYSQSLIDNVNRPVASRHNIQFAFPEGVFGQFFEIEWRKVFDTNFDMYGFDMRYYLVEGGTPRFSSTEGSILVDVSEDGLGSMDIQGLCQPFIVGPRP
jgi:hypothetical protein